MAKKLDRSRPFAEIFGSDADVRFNQDHADFDAAGNEIVADVSVKAAPVKAAAKPKPAAKPAEAPVEQGVDAQLAAQTGDFKE